MRLQIRNVSSLEKIFPEMSCFCAALDSASALKNEVFAYQIAYKTDDVSHCDPIFRLEVESELAEYICFYRSRCVPVLKPAFETEPDSEYLTRQPGLVPDVLEPYDGYVTASHNMSSLWVDVKLDEKVAAGVHSIKVHFREIESGEVWGTSEFQLEIIDAVLPKTDIPYTNWFHCDCISSYHNCEPLSERHWQLIDKYMQVAVEGGMNMILTPLFTPPLDTQVGAERPTVQLVDVAFADGKYTFGFDKLLRWFELCRKNGIEYLELSHLYSQWGAEKTPKIVVLEDGKLIKKFGWHTESMGEEYKEFIRQFIPVLKEFLIAKLNNILFDADTNEGVCVIDLDTVMPGSMLFDFGDSLRFGASSGAEDEKDLEKIWFQTEKFEQFTKGFVEEMKETICEKELEMLPVSVLILTYECGIRFLADYLNGDTYFKVHREGHNLDRARTQFKLVREIESKLDELSEIVKKYK